MEVINSQQNASGTLTIERLELQMPTRLRGNYALYQAEPQWQALQESKSLSSMTGRADRRWDAYSYGLYEDAKNIFSNLPDSDKQKVLEFRKKKTNFFSNFAQEYYNVVKLLASGNILRIDKTDTKGDISFRIISEHSAVVGAVAKELATTMADQLLQEKIEREGIDSQSAKEKETELRQQVVNEVVVGALLQDINKRMEIDFKAQDSTKQLEILKGLVEQGYGSEADIQTVTEDPVKGAGIYEKLLLQKRTDDYKKNDLLSRYGNIQTILSCARSSGMPVVSFPKDRNGHYLPTLAQKIANMADKLVQDTGLVIDLERRHQVCLIRYSPKELVDEEYKYASHLANEFAQIMGLTSGDKIPTYIVDNLLKLIANQNV